MNKIGAADDQTVQTVHVHLIFLADNLLVFVPFLDGIFDDSQITAEQRYPAS